MFICVGAQWLRLRDYGGVVSYDLFLVYFQHGVADPPYARPQKSRTLQQASNDSGQLDSMLGSLQSDMSKHGISTIPKGDCAACQKTIVGQVIKQQLI